MCAGCQHVGWIDIFTRALSALNLSLALSVRLSVCVALCYFTIHTDSHTHTHIRKTISKHFNCMWMRLLVFKSRYIPLFVLWRRRVRCTCKPVDEWTINVCMSASNRPRVSYYYVWCMHSIYTHKLETAMTHNRMEHMIRAECLFALHSISGCRLFFEANVNHLHFCANLILWLLLLLISLFALKVRMAFSS